MKKLETLTVAMANGPRDASMLDSVGLGPRRNSAAEAGDVPTSANEAIATTSAATVRDMDLLVMCVCVSILPYVGSVHVRLTGTQGLGTMTSVT